jgi:arsenate reductase
VIKKQLIAYYLSLITKHLSLNNMQFICYSKCTTCQKAKKWLEDNNIPFEERAIKEINPTFEELSSWLKISKLPVRKFFNTSGLLYKAENMKEKINMLSEAELLTILAKDGMMVKRPILVGDNFVLFGFKEPEWVENF